MISNTAIIKDSKGLHLKAATFFSGEALRFKSDIKIRAGNATLNAKSVLGVLGTGAECGDEVELLCNGEDEEEAMAVLIEILSNLSMDE